MPPDPFDHAAVVPSQEHRKSFGITAVKRARQKTMYHVHSCGFNTYHQDLLGSLPSDWSTKKKEDGTLIFSKINEGATVQVGKSPWRRVAGSICLSSPLISNVIAYHRMDRIQTSQCSTRIKTLPPHQYAVSDTSYGVCVCFVFFV